MRDVVFHSAALDREMKYRVILPSVVAAHQRLPVVLLLHGGGGDFREWSNDSDVAGLIKGNFVLLMPEGGYSYYVNAAEHPADRYEDYIADDLLSDAQARFPIARIRENRAIVGVSMGGFGAVKIALSHPELFVFAGALSPAIDVPRRQFSLRRIQQSRAMRSIFGPWDSETRRRDDPFLIARSVVPAEAPYLFLSCGADESLLAPVRQFAAVLAEQHLPHEFHIVPGGHEWTRWNKELPVLLNSLIQRVGRPDLQ
jgi:S-formylglutathione hydrolase FrmB